MARRKHPRRETYAVPYVPPELTAEQKRNIKYAPLNWGRLSLIMKALSWESDWRLGLGPGLDYLYEALKKSLDPRIELCEEINRMIRDWVESYDTDNAPGLGYRSFFYHWKIQRTFVPLQVRLAVEQILYDKGEPWRRLVSGFRPLTKA